ncbi:MAG TPA: carboxypeptidase regulatory-like domain-containing protein [Stellaceae bacterium]|jgi:streptogramin lyase/mono/diheme cytochrome c family protein|nr:carboxypeptidase regulatory-like domain-containing protein [Stellaceae bacterium]
MIARATIVLLALAAGPALAQQATTAPDGHRLFVQSCAVCHLKPSPTANTYGPTLTAAVIAGHEDQVRAAISDGSARMPGFKYDLQPAEIDAVVKYLASTPAPSAPEPAAAQTAGASGDAYLSGTIASSDGPKLGGVTVSAKPEGGTITTSVFTDEHGAYYFPALPAGSYAVWAQADGFATARGEAVALDGGKTQNFTLKPLADPERQLTGDQILASLPEATADDKRLKQLVHNNCSGCHTPSYILQRRFDEKGWTAVIDLMKRVNVGGIFQGDNAKPNAIIDFHEPELAAYLARARGPGASDMKLTIRPRPSGEAARVVFKEYDVPRDPALYGEGTYPASTGSDWALGTPTGIDGGHIVHDAWPDLTGNLWFTNNTPSQDISIGRVDAQTGAVRFLKIDAPNGGAANTHGMTRDAKGNIWFNVSQTAIPNHGGIGRLDPASGKIDVFVPPADMSGSGGAPTIDVDGTGKIWVSAPDGILRFDPDTQSFTGFKSPEFKTAHGTGLTYGVAADRTGHGYWAQMALDIVDRADPAGSPVQELKVPPVAAAQAGLKPDERTLYDGFAGLDFNTPFPWGQGPRRMGADKRGDVVWVNDFFGGSLFRIDTKTMQTALVPLPNGANEYPYHATVDSHHDVWINMMNSDQVLRYDPQAKRFTYFDLPTLGTETRYVSLLEKDGRMEVVLPYFRSMKVGVMSFRSEADLRALAAKAKQG